MYDVMAILATAGILALMFIIGAIAAQIADKRAAIIHKASHR